VSEKARKARHWWFMPIILTSWEAEIQRIVISGQPQQKCSKDPISKEKR
jgi:hypothetical protein